MGPHSLAKGPASTWRASAQLAGQGDGVWRQQLQPGFPPAVSVPVTAHGSAPAPACCGWATSWSALLAGEAASSSACAGEPSAAVTVAQLEPWSACAVSRCSRYSLPHSTCCCWVLSGRVRLCWSRRFSLCMKSPGAGPVPSASDPVRSTDTPFDTRGLLLPDEGASLRRLDPRGTCCGVRAGEEVAIRLQQCAWTNIMTPTVDCAPGSSWV